MDLAVVRRRARRNVTNCRGADASQGKLPFIFPAAGAPQVTKGGPAGIDPKYPN
jgi:hypothetical protein